jgi:hypothetical protein
MENNENVIFAVRKASLRQKVTSHGENEYIIGKKELLLHSWNQG